MTKTSFLCALLTLHLMFTGCADLSRAGRVTSDEPPGTGSASGEEPSGEDEHSSGQSVPTGDDPGKREAEESGSSRPLESGEEVAGRGEEPVREPVLSVYEARQLARRQLRPPLYTVEAAGQTLVHLEDLDLDGVPEVLVPCVYSEEEVDGGRFSDFSTLFQKDVKPYPFYLYTFLMENRGLTLKGRVGLGSRFVYGGIARVQIIRGKEKPFVLVVRFQTHEGEEQEWLVYTGEEVFPSSRLSLRESISSTVIVEDIDGDGRIDVVVQERGSEEGTGMETFLAWYAWNGRTFSERATTNVVRNLKSFLTLVKDLFEAGKWRRLTSVCFRPQEASRYFGRGMSAEEVVVHAFGLDEYYDQKERSSPEILEGIQRIVFPEFLENPFIAKDEMGWYFSLTFRILDAQGITIVNEIPLYMQKNPFLERQFFFSVEP